MRQVWRKFNLEKKPQRKTRLRATSRKASLHSYSLVQNGSFRGGVPAELRHPTSRDLAGEQAIHHPNSPQQTGPSRTMAPMDFQMCLNSCLIPQIHEQQEKTSYSRIPLGGTISHITYAHFLFILTEIQKHHCTKFLFP